jgi:hypothetical protein
VQKRQPPEKATQKPFLSQQEAADALALRETRENDRTQHVCDECRNGAGDDLDCALENFHRVRERIALDCTPAELASLDKVAECVQAVVDSIARLEAAAS